MTRRQDPPWWGGWVPIPREPTGPWWWFLRRRVEIGLALVAGALPAGAWMIRYSVVDVALVGAVGGMSLGLSEVRRLLAGQLRRLLVERRLRTAFRESGPTTRGGLVATPIRSASTISGDTVVWLWCPAGLTVESIAEVRAMLAQACFVDDVVVERHRRWSNVAVLTFLRSGLGRPA